MLVVDDHLVVAEGVAKAISSEYEIVGLITDASRLTRAVAALSPDLIVADVELPGMSGLEALRQLRASGSSTPVVFLTMHAEVALARSALAAGANGYILKSSSSSCVRKAMLSALAGEVYVSPVLGLCAAPLETAPKLSRQHMLILKLIGRGLTSRQIGEKLGLSVRTIEAHRLTMMRLFNVHTGIELVKSATRLGLIPAE